MSEYFNVILISLSRLLFSSPAFTKVAETSLSGARQVQDCPSTSPSGPLFRGSEVSDNPLLDVAPTTLPPRTIERSDTRFLDAPTVIPESESATGTRENSTIVFDPHYPSSDSYDDDILALNSFSLSLISDDSTDDSEFNVSESLDTLLSPPPPCSVTLQSSKLLAGVSGLGISGLMRKDGSGPFDGLGIVSIDSPSWRHQPDLSESIQGFRRRPCSSSAYDGSSESGEKISDIFLQETLLTFTEDPFHELCHSSTDSSSSILDCGGNSWSELCLDESTSMFKLINESHSVNESRPMVSNHRRLTPRRNTTSFSSPTISSELKRSSTILRNRSSSWPSTSTGATPLLRCKWRL